MNKAQNEIVELVATDLLGTCASLDECIEANDYHSDFTQEQMERLDELALQCECCSWWHEPSEVDDEGKCEECSDHQIIND